MPWTPIATPRKPYRRIWIQDSQGVALPEKPTEPSSPLTVFYFNDAHGCHFKTVSSDAGRLAFLSEKRNYREGDSLLLNGGDDFGGGGLIDLWMSERAPSPNPIFDILQKNGVDAVCPGNHDFDWGFTRFIAKAPKNETLPLIVVSNARDGTELSRRFHKLIYFDFDDKRVALLGLTNTENVPDAFEVLTAPQEGILEKVETASKFANIVVVLSHNGLSVDQKLLDLLPSSILLCGAHSHHTIPPIDESPHRSNYLQSGQQLATFGEARWTHGGYWSVSNIPLQQDNPPNEPCTRELAPDELMSFAVGVGNVVFDEPHFVAEDATLDKYRGCSAALNWACDTLFHNQISPSNSPSVVALCCSFSGSRNLSGQMGIDAWYQAFPYADRLYSIKIPWNLLPLLLQSNARRLLLPPGYRDDMGFLHFDRSITYDVTLIQGIEIRNLKVNGKPYRKDQYDSLTVYTHSYVITGTGGYESLFSSLGIWPTESKREGQSIRDTLWEAAKLRTTDSSGFSENRVTIIGSA